MKKYYLLFIFLTSFFSARSQTEIKGIASLQGGYTTELLGHSNMPNVDFSVGIEVNQIFRFSFSYLYSTELFTDNKPKPNFHLLGVKMEYLFRKNDKLFRPIIQLSATTEFSSNYKNGGLNIDDLFPWGGGLSINPMGGPPWASNFYYSTPFMGGINGGVAIRLIPNLHLNILAGYTIRLMKYKYLEYMDESEIDKGLDNRPTGTHTFNMLDVQLGLSYTFSFHKKEKPQP